MQKLLHLVLLLLVSFSLQAELYKGVNEEGNVSFSDKETPNAEKIPMPSPNTIKMPEPVPKQQASVESAETQYSAFKITSPKTNDTLRENTGAVAVTLELTPGLNTEAGHSIVISVDGKPVVKGTTALTSQLPDISRGSHVVKAFVKNKKGKTLITSNKVIFHLKRLSELHPKPAGSNPGPVDADGNPIHPGSSSKPGPVNPNGTSIKPGPQTPIYTPGPVIP